MAKPQEDYVSLVLPEVLKNPIAFFNFNKDERKKSQLQELLLKLNNKPAFTGRKFKKKWTTQKSAQRIKLKIKDLAKSKDASNRIIKRTALSTKYNFGYFGDLLMVMLNLQT